MLEEVTAMKPSIVSRAHGSIRCPDCQGLGYLATDSPLRRLPCDSCMGSAIDTSCKFYGPVRWTLQPLDLWRRHTVGDKLDVMNAVALCLDDPDHARA